MKTKMGSIIPIVIFSALSCSSNQQEDSNDNVFRVGNDNMDPTQNEVFFGNNRIQIEEISDRFDDTKKFKIQKIQQNFGDLNFTAKRIPTALYLQNQGLQKEELTEALTQVEDEQLFYFEIEESQKQDVIKKYFSENQDQNISYLSFDIHHDFKIVNGDGDTLKANYSFYERNFHIAPYERIVVSFSGINEGEELKLIYNDHLFGKGESTYSFAPSSVLTQNTNQPS